MKIPERHPGRPRRRSGVFTVNFKNISHLFLVFLLLNLRKEVLAGMNSLAFIYRSNPFTLLFRKFRSK